MWRRTCTVIAVADRKADVGGLVRPSAVSACAMFASLLLATLAAGDAPARSPRLPVASPLKRVYK